MTRVALVTGAAQGIGRAVALRLAKDGLDVAVNDMESNSSELEKLQQEIEQLGRKSICVYGDISQSDSVEKLMQEVAENLGSLDVVVANAGINHVKSILDTTVEEWDRIFSVNMRGVFLCYKEAAKIMIKQGRGGRIIGAGSIAGYKADPMTGSYTATKWGVRGLTQVAALEWGRHNITVNSYCPGFITTPMTDRMSEDAAQLKGTSKDHFMEGFVKNIPLGRTGCPDDVANLVSFIASKDADYITGQSILVNGGIVLS